MLSDLWLLQALFLPTFPSHYYRSPWELFCTLRTVVARKELTAQCPSILFCSFLWLAPFTLKQGTHHIASTRTVLLHDHCVQSLEARQLPALQLHSLELCSKTQEALKRNSIRVSRRLPRSFQPHQSSSKHVGSSLHKFCCRGRFPCHGLYCNPVFSECTPPALVRTFFVLEPLPQRPNHPAWRCGPTCRPLLLDASTQLVRDLPALGSWCQTLSEFT